MVDREKAIKQLKYLVFSFPWQDKPVSESDRMCNAFHKYAQDAVDLLKAQEPKAVLVTEEINHRKIGKCPNCGKWINSGDYPNYCGQCGQAVKWDG